MHHANKSTKNEKENDNKKISPVYKGAKDIIAHFLLKTPGWNEYEPTKSPNVKPTNTWRVNIATTKATINGMIENQFSIILLLFYW